MSMKRDFKNPVWYDEEKEAIICEIVIIDDEGNESTHNGKINKFSDSKQNVNPDWNTILEKYSVEDIDSATEEFDRKQKEKFEKDKEIQKEEEERQKERQRQEKLFAKKLEVFEIPEIKHSKNKALKT